MPFLTEPKRWHQPGTSVRAFFRRIGIAFLGAQMDSARPTLQKLVADVLNRLPAGQVPVEAWQFVCGKQVAQRTQALSFGSGVLRVEVPDMNWRDQLQGLSGSYLGKLNQYSRTQVERIEFVVAMSGPAVKGSGGSVAKPGRKRGPASEAERESRWRKQK
jgi:hypothetical protein